MSGCKRQSTATLPCRDLQRCTCGRGRHCNVDVHACSRGLHRRLLFFFFVQDYRLIAVWPLKLGLFRISHLYYKANAQLIYGATAINSERVIAWKAIIKVEAAGLRGGGCCCETINLLCLVLCIDIDNHSFCCNIM